MTPLNGRTSLVTGASQGLGRAIALRLMQEGSSVAINYLSNSAGAESLAAELPLVMAAACWFGPI